MLTFNKDIYKEIVKPVGIMYYVPATENGINKFVVAKNISEVWDFLFPIQIRTQMRIENYLTAMNSGKYSSNNGYPTYRANVKSSLRGINSQFYNYVEDHLKKIIRINAAISVYIKETEKDLKIHELSGSQLDRFVNNNESQINKENEIFLNNISQNILLQKAKINSDARITDDFKKYILDTAEEDPVKILGILCILSLFEENDGDKDFYDDVYCHCQNNEINDFHLKTSPKESTEMYCEDSLELSIKNRTEDALKLTTNYSGLIKQYSGSKDSFLKVDKITLPIILDYSWRDFENICIVDEKDRTYVIAASDPRTGLIFEHRDELFFAHSTSNIYNQLNIRVDDWYVNPDNKELCLVTSRTSYYASLVTNRVMDYVMKSGYSVRDLLQPGPFVPHLSQSDLSNHLGFNAFVITEDGYIPFVKRNNAVSIGKNTYGAIGASLKTMYALNAYDDVFTVEGLYKAIYKELEDELKIATDSSKITSKDHLLTAQGIIEIIAAYRDVVEGNKPQLLVLMKVNRNRNAISDNFTNAMKAKYQNKGELSKEEKGQEDGSILVWFSLQEFLDMEVTDNYFKVKTDNQENISVYTIVPSMSASIVIAKEYLKTHNNFF